MTVIKILGTGCTKCKKTEQMVRDTISKNGIEAIVEKVEDIQKIVEYNVMATPAVVVNEVVKIKGKIPTEKEILEALN
ncbi:MAG: thioredoxin family protein [Saprospiraceae bacterium]